MTLSSLVSSSSSMVVSFIQNNKLEIDPRIRIGNDDDENHFDYVFSVSLPSLVVQQLLPGEDYNYDNKQGVKLKFGIQFPIMSFWLQLAMVSIWIGLV